MDPGTPISQLIFFKVGPIFAPELRLYVSLLSENDMRHVFNKFRGVAKANLLQTYRNVKLHVDALRDEFRASGQLLQPFLSSKAIGEVRDLAVFIVLQYVLVHKPMDIGLQGDGVVLPYQFDSDDSADPPSSLEGGCTIA